MQVTLSGRVIVIAIVVLVLAAIGSIVVITGDAAEGRIGIIVALLGPILLGFMQLLRAEQTERVVEKTEVKVDRIESAVNGPAVAERAAAADERTRVQARDDRQDAT